MKLLVSDCVDEVPSRGKKAEEGKDSGAANHDVYYVDQLASEKEERKEWIDLR